MIKEHGQWEAYKPTSPRPFPGRTQEGPIMQQHVLMYARRIDTGDDWYDYRKQFNGDTVLMTIWPSHLDGPLVVQAVTRDVQMIFPAGAMLIELQGYTGDDPFAEFSGTVYENGTLTGSKYQPKTRNLLQELDDVKGRIERLEQLLTARGLLDE